MIAQPRKTTSNLGLFAAALAVFVFPQPAVSDSIDNLAQELAELRGRVEQLYADLDARKAELKNRVASLSLQKSDLEASLRREELRLKQLQQTLNKNRELAKESGADNERLEPLVLAAAEGLQGYIRAGLPFKTAERLAAVEELKTAMQSDVLPATKAVNRLWALYEDEIRLAGENGLYRQTVPVGDADVLADVARLGTVMMFYKTKDAQYGHAVKGDQGWTFEPLYDSDDKEQVATLFDALQKQIRSGYFELPNALSGVEVK